MPWPKVQDNRIVAILIGIMVVLAWWALWVGEQSAWGHQALHGNAMFAGSPLTFAALFVVGWTVMTIAMMLPTSSPLILIFRRMTRSRPHSGWLIAILVTGYLLVWIFFGSLIYVLNRGAHIVAWNVVWLRNRPVALQAGILLGAGLYQFSALKYACLDKCRSPFAFVASRWRGKRVARESFWIGAEHGVYCVGCCWSLMLVMLAISTASFAWMLALGAIMAAEKNLPFGHRLSAPFGMLLLSAAVIMFARTT